ncbi:MAG: LysE family translocator [Beijerinckiaceae bacterium]|nr:LysE family translocator [Beijerinckiaceae bacterium]
MDHGSLLALIAFAFVSSVTPGPNNLMLMASGANFGLRRTLPHMLGVGIGFSLMIFLVGVGLVGLFALWPPAFTLLKVVGVAYMLWLAWKIANAEPPASADPDSGGKPMTFLQAALFQWVNPKAWTMALTSVTVYAPDRDIAAITLVTFVFGAINLPTVSCWATLGTVMRRWLTNRARLRAFNWSMAGLLVASLVVMI